MLEWLLCAASLAGAAAPPPSTELLEFIGDWDEHEAALLDHAEIPLPAMPTAPAARARPAETRDQTQYQPTPSPESPR